MLTKVYFSPTFLLSNKHKCIIFRVVQFPFQIVEKPRNYSNYPLIVTC